MTFSSLNMRDQIMRALEPYTDEFNIPGIVDSLQDQYGTVDINTIPTVRFWRHVFRNELTDELVQLEYTAMGDVMEVGYPTHAGQELMSDVEYHENGSEMVHEINPDRPTVQRLPHGPHLW